MGWIPPTQDRGHWQGNEPSGFIKGAECLHHISFDIT